MQFMDDFFIQHIHQFVPSWKYETAKTIRVTKTIGITNKTYIIESDSEPHRIIFRHYGETGEGLFLDRDQEIKICKTLANLNLGPDFYGHTEHIRVEKYIDNEILKQENMKDKLTIFKVAKNLAQLHEVNMDIDQTPLFQKYFSENSEMLKQVRNKLNSILFNKEEKTILNKVSDWFGDQEIQFLRKTIPNDDIVFSHNDLLANNILVIPPIFDKVVFIDFEYSCYNFRGFDIANYFIESQFNYMNPNPPYFFIEEGTVSDDVLLEFVNAYMDASKNQLSVENLMKQIKIGMMLSHYFWAAWALKMAKENDIEFDYLSFIEVRYHKYYQLKRKFFS